MHVLAGTMPGVPKLTSTHNGINPLPAFRRDQLQRLLMSIYEIEASSGICIIQIRAPTRKKDCQPLLDVCWVAP
jgi:hypothetical protein